MSKGDEMWSLIQLGWQNHKKNLQGGRIRADRYE